MTPSGERDERADARRLHDTLHQPDDLSHAQAELLIALLVEAEAENQDVDDDPTFAPLFSHLDRCADCLALYEAAAEDYAATIAQQRGRTPSVDQKPRPVPAMRLPPMPSTYHTFEVLVHTPRHAARAALREQPSMYSAIPHANVAHVEVHEDAHGTTLLVEILAPTATSSWVIEVVAHDFRAEAHTDSTGRATFTNLPPAASFTVRGREEAGD